MVIVDTSAWIEFFRRDGKLQVKLAVKALLEEYEATLCGPVEMEFLGGAYAREREKLKKWFDVIPYLPNDQKLWRKASETYATLRAKGVTRHHHRHVDGGGRLPRLQCRQALFCDVRRDSPTPL